MNKKVYIKPSFKVLKIRHGGRLLEGSSWGGEGDNSRSIYFDEEE